MNNINFQREMDRLIEDLVREGRRPSLLLHSCCAPCSSYCIEYLSKYFDITVLYYNPNIAPEEEYYFRKEEQKRFIGEFSKSLGRVSFLDCDYESGKFYEAVKGLENEPEGGARCRVCFELRLSKTAREANHRGFDYFATTLTISPLKNAAVLNEVGKLCEEGNTKYLPSDFKKKNGYLRSTEISKEYNMYRQDYCGCVFSYSK